MSTYDDERRQERVVINRMFQDGARAYTNMGKEIDARSSQELFKEMRYIADHDFESVYFYLKDELIAEYSSELIQSNSPKALKYWLSIASKPNKNTEYWLSYWGLENLIKDIPENYRGVDLFLWDEVNDLVSGLEIDWDIMWSEGDFSYLDEVRLDPYDTIYKYVLNQSKTSSISVEDLPLIFERMKNGYSWIKGFLGEYSDETILEMIKIIDKKPNIKYSDLDVELHRFEIYLNE